MFASHHDRTRGAAGGILPTWNSACLDQWRRPSAGPPLPEAPRTTRGFICNRPSRCIFLRASLRARRILLPRFLFRGFLVIAAELHLAEHALALHLLLQHL